MSYKVSSVIKRSAPALSLISNIVSLILGFLLRKAFYTGICILLPFPLVNFWIRPQRDQKHIYSTPVTPPISTMVLVLDGNSDIDAQ